MKLEEKQYLSIIYSMTDTLSGYPQVTITEEYPEDTMVLPTVALIEKPIYISPKELGNRIGKRQRDWIIEVFANSRAQRDALAITILDDIEPGIEVYDYDLGFPPSVTPPQIGTLRIIPNTLSITPTFVFPELVEKLYWRSSIHFMTEYENII